MVEAFFGQSSGLSVAVLVVLVDGRSGGSSGGGKTYFEDKRARTSRQKK